MKHSKFIKKASDMIKMRNITKFHKRLTALEEEKSRLYKGIGVIDESYEKCEKYIAQNNKECSEVPIDIMLLSRIKTLEQKKKAKLNRLVQVEKEIVAIKRDIKNNKNEGAMHKKR